MTARSRPGRRMQLSNALGVWTSQRIMWFALRGRLQGIAPDPDVFVDALFLGGLARLSGRHAEAVAHFETTIQLGPRMGPGRSSHSHRAGSRAC